MHVPGHVMLVSHSWRGATDRPPLKSLDDVPRSSACTIRRRPRIPAYQARGDMRRSPAALCSCEPMRMQGAGGRRKGQNARRPRARSATAPRKASAKDVAALAAGVDVVQPACPACLVSGTRKGPPIPMGMARCCCPCESRAPSHRCPTTSPPTVQAARKGMRLNTAAPYKRSPLHGNCCSQLAAAWSRPRRRHGRRALSPRVLRPSSCLPVHADHPPAAPDAMLAACRPGAGAASMRRRALRCPGCWLCRAAVHRPPRECRAPMPGGGCRQHRSCSATTAQAQYSFSSI